MKSGIDKEKTIIREQIPKQGIKGTKGTNVMGEI